MAQSSDTHLAAYTPDDLSVQHESIEQAERWTGIAFELMGHYFVAPLGEVTEVIHPPSYTRVPNTQPWLKGLANIRGRLLAVSSLSEFISKQNYQEHTQHKVMCISHNQHYIGLIVDQVFGVQHFNKTHYFSHQHDLGMMFQPYCRGYFQQYQQRWHIFLLSQLLGNHDFMNASQHN